VNNNVILELIYGFQSCRTAEEWAEKIADGEGGALVIDNSSAFRYTDGIPLVVRTPLSKHRTRTALHLPVHLHLQCMRIHRCTCLFPLGQVPEINADAARKSDKKLIANPNCTTAIALMALAPLHKEFGIKRCIMSTYQAASGAGAPGMRELEEGSAQFVKGEKVEHSVFAHQLPFNVIPHIDKFLDDKYTKEERKVTWETRKIMDLPDLPVSCTCVRIPTLRAHGESITIETEKPINMDRVYAVLNEASGVVVVDDTSKNLYPMPITASTKFDVEVGRLRVNDVFGENGLDMFVVGDQLLRGAALNAVLIAEAVM